MLPRPLLLAGCFIMAMFAGWAARNAKTQQSAVTSQATSSSSAAAASAALTIPAEMSDEAARMWLADHLTDLTTGQLREVANRLLTVPDLSERAWSGLFSRWFEKDPAAAWDFAATKPEQRSIALLEWAALDPPAARASIESPSQEDWEALLEGTARKDVEAAFRLLDQALAGGFDASEVSLPFEDLACKDPEAAAAWAERLKIPLAGIEGGMLWGRWKHDPAAAKAWLGQQDDPARIMRALASLAHGLDAYDPALMDFIAAHHPAGNARIEAIQSLLKKLAFRDPEFAAKEAARVIPDANVRSEVIAKIASLLADNDFTKAWSLLDSLGPSLKGNQRLQIPDIELQAGTESGTVEGPLRYGRSLIYPPDATSVAEEKSYLLRSMLETDKEEAIRLMDGIPPGHFFDEAMGAFKFWADRDKEEAVRWLAGKLGDQGDFHFDNDGWRSVAQLLQKDFNDDERAALLDSLPAGSVRTVLATMRARDLAGDDPLAALDFARAAGTAEEPVIAAYGSWSSTDAMAALKHLTGDPAAPARAWEIVAEAAFEDSPEEAAQIIGALPDMATRDAAISSVLEFLEGSGPLETSPWALALSDPGKRKQALEAVLHKVSMDLRLASDPATADALRQQLEATENLPAAERQHWLDRIHSECTAP